LWRNPSRRSGTHLSASGGLTQKIKETWQTLSDPFLVGEKLYCAFRDFFAYFRESLNPEKIFSANSRKIIIPI